MNGPSQTFRAYRCRELGDYHDLELEELPALAPADDEVVINNRAFAVGFPEYLMIRGEYQLKPPLPFTPGMECSGDIVAVGSGVEGFSVGQPVLGTTRIGACAEQVAIRAENCLPLPDTFDYAAGASYLAAYKTAYVGLVERGHLRPGELLLVHGAAGGVGLAAVDLAKSIGATVIATGSSDDKLAVVRQKGADHVINIREQPRFRERVKELSAGRGADVVYDPVGGDVFDESMRSIAPFGRLLVVGFAGGRIPAAAVNYVLIKQLSIIGVRAGEFGRLDPVGGRRVLDRLLELAEAGRVKPHIHRRYRFEQLAEAFDDIVERRVIGRSVVEV